MSHDWQRRAADRMPPPWKRTRLQRVTWPLMPAEVLVILLVVAIPLLIAQLLGA
jgi:hypothetical protein